MRDQAALDLIAIARDLQTRLLRRLRDERGYRGLRPSLGPFLSLIWTEGRPLAVLAERLAISRQACSQLASLAEHAGYLQRDLDPSGRRARQVRLSPRGRQLVEDAVEVILETESEYAELVGAAGYRRFTASCGALFVGLGIPAHANPGLHDAAGRSIGVLPLVAHEIEGRLLQATRSRGHGALTRSHAQILPRIGPEGVRMRELARAQRVSRQAISAAARDLEALRYLRSERDPNDRRGVWLRLTGRGERLVRNWVAALDALEASFRRLLGDRRLEELRCVASKLSRGLRVAEASRAAGGLTTTSAAEGEPTLHDIASTLSRRLGARDAARLGVLLAAAASEATL
jgi:DNA-binding MarR family transcriptional regulator